MRDDLLTAIRRMTRNRGSTGFILFLLALTMAINACVFSVAYGMLWKPLPYPAQNRLVQLTARSAKMGIDLGWPAPYLDAVSKGSRQLEEVAGYRRKEVSVAQASGNYTGTAEILEAEPQLFSLVGARPELGRLLSADDAEPGADSVALIGSDLWQARFGKSDSVLEQKVYLGGRAYRIVGVLSQSFAFPTRAIQIWLPMGYSEAELAMSNAGSFGSLRAIGRLKPASTAGGAGAEMMRLVRSDPALMGIADEIDLQVAAQPLHNLWLSGRDHSLKSMLVAALLVFSVTIANAYNLFILRMLQRRQEFALLEAVGATRTRRAAQIAIEAGLLSIVATLLAIVVVPFGIALLRHFDVLPAGIPQSIGFDLATAGAILAMCAIAAVILSSSSIVFHNQNVYEVLRQTGNGQTASPGMHRLRRGLVVGQIAATFVLLFGTVLLVRSSHQLLGEDVGFDRSNQLIGTIQPVASEPGGDPAVIRSSIAAWASVVEADPEIQAVGLSSSAPFSQNVTLEGFRGPGGNGSGQRELPKAYISYVNANYPRAVGLPILWGRSFTSAEAEQGAPVALIDEDVADRYFHGIDPLSRTVGVTDSATGELVNVTVAGVVGRVRQRTLMNRDEYPSIYLLEAVPYAVPGVSLNSVEVVVRTKRLSIMADVIQQRLQTTAPNLRLTQLTPMEQRISETIIDVLRLNSLLQILSAFTVLLTAVGLYALLSHAVAMRHREFGIRLALGATARDLLVGVLAEGGRMMAFAFAFGVPLALLLGSALRSRLHDVSAFDPISMLIVCVLLLVVGLVANVVPAYRASRVKPMEALRSD